MKNAACRIKVFESVKKRWKAKLLCIEMKLQVSSKAGHICLIVAFANTVIHSRTMPGKLLPQQLQPMVRRNFLLCVQPKAVAEAKPVGEVVDVGESAYR